MRSVLRDSVECVAEDHCLGSSLRSLDVCPGGPVVPRWALSASTPSRARSRSPPRTRAGRRACVLGSGFPLRTLRPEVVDLSPAFPAGPCSAMEAAAREEARRNTSACLDLALATGTRNRYCSALNVIVGGVERRVGAELLPVDNEAKFFAIFAGMMGEPWGTIQVNKAAVRAWHQSEGFLDWVSEVSTERTRRFWQGLRKAADHRGLRTKVPISHDQLLAFVDFRWATF